MMDRWMDRQVISVGKEDSLGGAEGQRYGYPYYTPTRIRRELGRCRSCVKCGQVDGCTVSMPSYAWRPGWGSRTQGH